MQAFSKIRVIDFTHVIAGPFCAYQLAVLGADVIKIEQPEGGDMVRQDGALQDDNARGMGSVFVGQNSNKRSVAIDIKSKQGRDIALELIRAADVVVENYRSGALASLGLGYEDVCKINPAIIYCSLTGFGQTGPKAEHTAYDNVIQAFSGLMASTGDEDTAPVKVGPPVLDYATGAQAAFAIAAALFHRAQTGEGQYIDIAMLDSALMLMGANITHYQSAQELAPLSGNSSVSKPGYGCYSTAEGLLMIGAYTTKQHADMWKVLGDEVREQKMRDATFAELGAQYDEDVQAIQSVLRQKTAEQWEHLFAVGKVPAARVRSVDETLKHPQIASRTVMQNPQGNKRGPAFPTAAFINRTGSPRLNSAPPTLGEHTREVLIEFGYADHLIDEFAAEGIVGSC